MRVVSLVPSITEALHALGLEPGDELVGVTSFCVHPEDARKRARVVGGTKTPKIDRIRGLAPDLVVVNFEENRKEDVDALRDAGVPILVTDVRTVADAAAMMRQLGEATGRQDAAEAIAASIDAVLAERESAIAILGDPIPVFVPIWKEPWMAFNGDTFAHDVLRLAGARNVLADDAVRYPETSPESALAKGARLAILPSEPWVFKEPDAAELRERGFADAVLLDGEALTWYGSRTPDGVRHVAAVVDGARQRLMV